MSTAESNSSDSSNSRWFKADCDSTITVLFDESKPIRFSTAYWNIRGLGAPLRMMLCAAKLNHVVQIYDFLEDGENGWKSVYFTEKVAKFVPEYTPFMNLPAIADEDEKVVITQLNACLFYVGSICGMMGQNLVEQATCVQYLSEVYDLRCAICDYVYGEKGTVESVMKCGRNHFSKFENHLKNKDTKCCTVGNSVSAPDFHLFEMIDQYTTFQKVNDPTTTDFLTEYPNVGKFFDEFSKLEENQFYLNSMLHKQLPFNAAMAIFGSDLNGGVYQQRRGPDADSLPCSTWCGIGNVTLRP